MGTVCLSVSEMQPVSCARIRIYSVGVIRTGSAPVDRLDLLARERDVRFGVHEPSILQIVFQSGRWPEHLGGSGSPSTGSRLPGDQAAPGCGRSSDEKRTPETRVMRSYVTTYRGSPGRIGRPEKDHARPYEPLHPAARHPRVHVVRSEGQQGPGRGRVWRVAPEDSDVCVLRRCVPRPCGRTAGGGPNGASSRVAGIERWTGRRTRTSGRGRPSPDNEGTFVSPFYTVRANRTHEFRRQDPPRPGRRG